MFPIFSCDWMTYCQLLLPAACILCGVGSWLETSIHIYRERDTQIYTCQSKKPSCSELSFCISSGPRSCFEKPGLLERERKNVSLFFLSLDLRRFSFREIEPCVKIFRNPKSLENDLIGRSHLEFWDHDISLLDRLLEFKFDDRLFFFLFIQNMISFFSEWKCGILASQLEPIEIYFLKSEKIDLMELE